MWLMLVWNCSSSFSPELPSGKRGIVFSCFIGWRERNAIEFLVVGSFKLSFLALHGGQGIWRTPPSPLALSLKEDLSITSLFVGELDGTPWESHNATHGVSVCVVNGEANETASCTALCHTSRYTPGTMQCDNIALKYKKDSISFPMCVDEVEIHGGGGCGRLHKPHSSVIDHLLCRRSQVWSLASSGRIGETPFLKPWRVTVHQCGQHWIRWTNSMTLQNTASCVPA